MALTPMLVWVSVVVISLGGVQTQHKVTDPLGVFCDSMTLRFSEHVSRALHYNVLACELSDERLNLNSKPVVIMPDAHHPSMLWSPKVGADDSWLET